MGKRVVLGVVEGGMSLKISHDAMFLKGLADPKRYEAYIEKLINRPRPKDTVRKEERSCAKPYCTNKFMTTVRSKKRYCSEYCSSQHYKLRHDKLKREREKILLPHELDFLKNLKVLKPSSGIYFLYDKGTLQYIGKTKDLHVRRKEWERSNLFK